MSWAFLYYLISIVDSVDIFCSFFGILTILVSLIAVVIFLELYGGEFGKNKKYIITGFIVGFFLLISSILIPDKEDLLVISGLKMSEKPITGIIEEYSPKLKLLIDSKIDELLKKDGKE